MADDHDHLEDQNQSRPFLASTEAHQATLMKEVKKQHGQPAIDADTPAPMLPPIMNQAAAESVEKEAEDSVPTPNLPPPPDNAQTNEAAPRRDAVHEASHLLATPSYPNSGRIVAGIAVAVVALVGFSAIWYSANQDIYTLGGQDENQGGSIQASHKLTPPQTSQPATLGAETELSQTITLSLSNLPALTQGSYYLWAKQGDTASALGRFTINEQGQAVSNDNQAFTPQFTAGQAETIFLVSIEAGDNPKQPSGSIILNGSLKGGEAHLGFTAIDLAQASGVYTIAAPTDLSGDYQSSGIWFAKTDGHTLTGPGLSIPNAPEGWKYEAQLAYKDQIIAAGRFSNPDDRDNFGVFTPNPDHTPYFPGEDYIQGAPSRLGVDFPANLTSGEWKVIISIEPDQDGTDPTGDGTFFLQPFTATIAEGTENYTEQPLTLDTSTFPTATITLK